MRVMKIKSKAIFFVSFMLGSILLTKIIVDHFLPNLTFINKNLIITFRILRYFTVLWFTISLLYCLKPTKNFAIPIGFVLLPFFILFSWIELYPIDTTTKPIDVSILHINPDGTKLIVRERKNAKTNRVILDTVLVKDNFVFRQILETRK